MSRHTSPALPLDLSALPDEVDGDATVFIRIPPAQRRRARGRVVVANAHGTRGVRVYLGASMYSVPDNGNSYVLTQQSPLGTRPRRWVPQSELRGGMAHRRHSRSPRASFPRTV